MISSLRLEVRWARRSEKLSLVEHSKRSRPHSQTASLETSPKPESRLAPSSRSEGSAGKVKGRSQRKCGSRASGRRGSPPRYNSPNATRGRSGQDVRNVWSGRSAQSIVGGSAVAVGGRQEWPVRRRRLERATARLERRSGRGGCTSFRSRLAAPNDPLNLPISAVSWTCQGASVAT